MQFFRQIEGRIFEKNFISAKNYHIFFEKRLKLFYLYIRGFPPFFFFRKTFIKKLSSVSAEKNAVKEWKRLPRREKKSCKMTRLQSGGTKRLQNKRRCKSHRFSAVSSTTLQTNKTIAPPNKTLQLNTAAHR